MKKVSIIFIAVLFVLTSLLAVYRFNLRKSIPENLSYNEKLKIIFEQNDCYACHSNNPNTPFYSNFPIIGDQVKDDILKAQKYLLLDEVNIENINEADFAKIEQTMLTGSMPLLKYKVIHWGTGFNKKEKNIIATWVREERVKKYASCQVSPIFENEPIRPLVNDIVTDAQKVALGFKLYHDGRISADGTVSCATCHPLDKGGADGLRTSKGINGQLGGINAPTVYNSVFNHVQFWNGRAADLQEQAAGPPVNPIEMGLQSWDDIVDRLKNDKELVKEFSGLYAEGLTANSVTDAIAEFEKTLITLDSKFDKYLKGDRNAISQEQIKGYELFKSFNCATCHVGKIMGGQSFETMGIAEDYFLDRAKYRPDLIYNDDDKGLFGFTGKESDLHKFKVPTLRNIALTAPYLHDGSAETLSDAVIAMIRFQTGYKYTERDVENIVDFMHTLTGEHEYLNK